MLVAFMRGASRSQVEVATEIGFRSGARLHRVVSLGRLLVCTLASANCWARASRMPWAVCLWVLPVMPPMRVLPFPKRSLAHSPGRCRMLPGASSRRLVAAQHGGVGPSCRFPRDALLLYWAGPAPFGWLSCCSPQAYTLGRWPRVALGPCGASCPGAVFVGDRLFVRAALPGELVAAATTLEGQACNHVGDESEGRCAGHEPWTGLAPPLIKAESESSCGAQRPPVFSLPSGP